MEDIVEEMLFTECYDKNGVSYMRVKADNLSKKHGTKVNNINIKLDFYNNEGDCVYFTFNVLYSSKGIDYEDPVDLTLSF